MIEHKKNTAFLKLSLTTWLLQLFLHNMQSSVWKSIGQYDYPKLMSSITKPRHFVYVTLAIDLLKNLISHVVSMQFSILNYMFY